MASSKDNQLFEYDGAEDKFATSNRNPIKTWFITFPRTDISPKDFQYPKKSTQWIVVVQERHKVRPLSHSPYQSKYHLHICIRLSEPIRKNDLKGWFDRTYPEDCKRIDYKPVGNLKGCFEYMSKECRQVYKWSDQSLPRINDFNFFTHPMRELEEGYITEEDDDDEQIEDDVEPEEPLKCNVDGKFLKDDVDQIDKELLQYKVRAVVGELCRLSVNGCLPDSMYQKFRFNKYTSIKELERDAVREYLHFQGGLKRSLFSPEKEKVLHYNPTDQEEILDLYEEREAAIDTMYEFYMK